MITPKAKHLDIGHLKILGPFPNVAQESGLQLENIVKIIVEVFSELPYDTLKCKIFTNIMSLLVIFCLMDLLFHAVVRLVCQIIGCNIYICV